MLFEAFSDLQEDEEIFFLRPDRIMGSFLLDPYMLPIDDSIEKVKLNRFKYRAYKDWINPSNIFNPKLKIIRWIYELV